jgi:hypothetical protein
VLWLAYVLVLRHQLALVPAAAAVMTGLSVLRQGFFRAFPAALIGSLVAAMLIFAVGVLWSRRLTADSQTPEPSS